MRKKLSLISHMPVWLVLFIATTCVIIGVNIIPNIRTKLIDLHIIKE